MDQQQPIPLTRRQRRKRALAKKIAEAEENGIPVVPASPAVRQRYWDIAGSLLGRDSECYQTAIADPGRYLPMLYPHLLRAERALQEMESIFIREYRRRELTKIRKRRANRKERLTKCKENIRKWEERKEREEKARYAEKERRNREKWMEHQSTIKSSVEKYLRARENNPQVDPYEGSDTISLEPNNNDLDLE